MAAQDFSTSVAHIHAEHRLSVPAAIPMSLLLGPADSVLRAIEQGFPALDIHVRGSSITLRGPEKDVSLASQLLEELIEVVGSGTPVTPEIVTRSIGMLTESIPTKPADVMSFNVFTSKGRSIRPKTVGQKHYVDAIETNTITFGIGPAGTGKTYLAMAMAVQALQAKQVNRIVLTRPAVEAGERLGFLPGSLSDKIDPYLRPLYDALRDMIDPEAIARLTESGTIEVAPLAYMRGRTLNDAFIILDEAQNTTKEQMKMFLTRLGAHSKMVVTGDNTQVDLPGGTVSGLRIIEDILSGVDDIEFCHLSAGDVVRHSLVSSIIDAYSRWDVSSGANHSARNTTRGAKHFGTHEKGTKN